MEQTELIFARPWAPAGYSWYVGLSEDERRVLNALIDRHEGRENAIRVDDLVSAAFPFRPGKDGRTVRDIVKTLRETHHVKVLTTVHRPYGVYLCETRQEWLEFKKTQRARVFSILRGLAEFENISVPDLLGQLRLEVEQAANETVGT